MIFGILDYFYIEHNFALHRGRRASCSVARFDFEKA
jgi:hypothetical protein